MAHVTARAEAQEKMRVFLKEHEHRYDGRVSFSLAFFPSAIDAGEFEKLVEAAGCTYIGGWMDGHPCGRRREFDHEKDGKFWFAVSF